METQQLSYCACCANSFETTDTFCNSCGYPLQGTPEEQDSYIANRTVKEIDLIELNKKVDAASKSLYWIGGLLAFWTGINYFLKQDDPDMFAILITNVIVVVAFFALGIWSKSKPVAALISGLSLYGILIILSAIDDPTSLAKGIIVKVIIIGYLIKGIKAVLEVDKIKKELNII